MGKCFDDDTKAAQTPTLQISSLLSGAQYCHFAPSVFFAYGYGKHGQLFFAKARGKMFEKFI